jgi:hypothetical protein
MASENPSYIEILNDLNLTVDDLVNMTNAIANKLASSIKFGIYSISDIMQEAHLEAIKGVTKFKHSKISNNTTNANMNHLNPNYSGLANFLFIHIRNRLLNLKRDKHFRYEKKYMSKIEHIKNNNETAKNMTTNDSTLNNYVTINKSKSMLSSMYADSDVTLSKIGYKYSKSFQYENYLSIIESNIKHFPRELYLKLKCGLHLTKKQTNILFYSIEDILNKHGITYT